MPPFLHATAQRAIATIAGWPALGLWDGVGLAIGVAALILSVIPLVQARRWGERAQNAALERLAFALRQRLRSNPELLTGRAVRGLARSIQESMSVPAITDSLTAATIRSTALEQELTLRGKALRRRLEVLNDLLKEFDPKGPPLMSIASEDPLLAYLLCGLSVAIAILYAQIYLTQVTGLLCSRESLFGSCRFSILVWQLELSGPVDSGNVQLR